LQSAQGANPNLSLRSALEKLMPRTITLCNMNWSTL
jgi:hypothetical protein